MYRVVVKDNDGIAPGDAPPLEFPHELLAHQRAETLLEAFLTDGDLEMRVSVVGPDGKTAFSLTPAAWAAGDYLYQDGYYANRI